MTWDFHDFPGAFPVTVLEADPPRRIVIEWDGVIGTGFKFKNDGFRIVIFFNGFDLGEIQRITAVVIKGWFHECFCRVNKSN